MSYSRVVLISEQRCIDNPTSPLARGRYPAPDSREASDLRPRRVQFTIAGSYSKREAVSLTPVGYRRLTRL